VSIDELVLGIDIALGAEQQDACPSLGTNPTEPTGIAAIVSAVSHALRGCP
jgi:hypothetical protein